jgi:ABC-type dipeptide/oligopeptide/nickel transport system permease subunit
LRRLLRNRMAMIGLLLVAIGIITAVFAPVFALQSPDEIDTLAMLSSPSPAHILGTDDLGRDTLSRLVYGARVSLSASTAAVALAMLMGVPLGLVAGYLGGAIDEAVMRVLDSVMALPPLVLALTIAAVLGPGLVNGMLAIAVVSVPTFTRLVRGQVLSIKHDDFVLAARSIGASNSTIIFRHVLPNSINPVIVQAALGVGFAIITESSLSFIGLGAQPPTPSWGSMVQVGFQYLELAPWLVLAPALVIFIAVLGFNLLGEGLRDMLDPNAASRSAMRAVRQR